MPSSATTSDQSLRDDLAALTRGLSAWLRAYQGRGVRGVPMAARFAPGQPQPARAAAGESAAIGKGAQRPTLADIRAWLGDCQRCRLSSERKQIVFGVGDPGAALMFIGEGPGRDEDIQGEPFVGAAGQLLTRMIRAMGLERADVYIANVIKCRPPKNRNPLPDEVATCEPFLHAQIAAVAPRVIVALGGVAAQALLRTDLGISKLRGRFHDFRGIPLLPTFHPAYLLRNPEAKRPAWADLQLVMAEMDGLLLERSR